MLKPKKQKKQTGTTKHKTISNKTKPHIVFTVPHVGSKNSNRHYIQT